VNTELTLHLICSELCTRSPSLNRICSIHILQNIQSMRVCKQITYKHMAVWYSFTSIVTITLKIYSICILCSMCILHILLAIVTIRADEHYTAICSLHSGSCVYMQYTYSIHNGCGLVVNYVVSRVLSHIRSWHLTRHQHCQDLNYPDRRYYCQSDSLEHDNADVERNGTSNKR